MSRHKLYCSERKQILTSRRVAVLMLTSGPTGSPKAVMLTNFQILCSVMGKCKMHKTDVNSRFLNCKSNTKS
jgi:long-subunit acyl-CoA synthetase (AMP-forming)